MSDPHVPHLASDEMLAISGPQAEGWRQAGEVCRRLDMVIGLLSRLVPDSAPALDPDAWEESGAVLGGDAQ